MAKTGLQRIPLQEPRWFAAMTAPNEESKAATWLTRAGYWVAFPFDRVQTRRKRALGRTIVEWIERPRFARYVFVALRYVNEPLGPINDTPGVSRLVCRRLSGEPLQIPTPIMDAILDERLFSLDDGRGGIVLTETFRDPGQRDSTYAREVRTFVNSLGKWKAQEVAA